MNLLLLLLLPGWAMLMVGFLTAPYGVEDQNGFRTAPVPANDREVDPSLAHHGAR